MSKGSRAKRSLFNIGSVHIPKNSRSIKLRLRAKNSEAWGKNVLPATLASGQGKVAEEINRKPIAVIAVAAAVLVGLLAYELFHLQIVNGGRLLGLAEGNRVREKVNYAQRGRILDRNGQELATNTATFQLAVTPYLMSKDAANREAVYKELGNILGDSEDIRQKAEAKELDYTQPILVKENIAYETALKIEQRIPELAGFSLDEVPTRQYQPGLAHILGYVGRVNEEELKTNSQLLPVDFIGKDGIEAQYDSLIRGQNGYLRTEVDAAGKPIRNLAEQATQAGNDIQLTLDYGLQIQFKTAIAESMARAGSKKAAGVALDPKTGEVLAMVSLPDFDNNLFSKGISEAELSGLVNDKLSPLQNKALSASYPSGSIIKPMHIVAALNEGIVNENTIIVDAGKIVVPNIYDPSIEYVFNGWNPSGLGPMNARRAVAMSSDIYFYHTGGGFKNFKGLGVTKLTEYYRRFGLGSFTGIDLPGESLGRVPTPEWLKATHGREWTTGDTYNISIGQGDILVSPLQMAVGTAALLNEGKLLQPHLFKESADHSAKAEIKVTNDVQANPQWYKVAREGMKQVIGGTTPVSTFASVPVPVAGKSGTAETDPEAKKKSHAWYTAFAPYDNPEIIFCVLLEEGEGGSQYAAPAIAKTMSWYFSKANPNRR